MNRNNLFSILALLVLAGCGAGAVQSSDDLSADDADLTGPRCHIGKHYYANGKANPANPCQVCDTTQTKKDWSARADGTACGTGLVCEAAACVSAVPANFCNTDADCKNGAACIFNGCTEVTDDALAGVGGTMASPNVVVDGTGTVRLGTAAADYGWNWTGSFFARHQGVWSKVDTAKDGKDAYWVLDASAGAHSFALTDDGSSYHNQAMTIDHADVISLGSVYATTTGQGVIRDALYDSTGRRLLLRSQQNGLFVVVKDAGGNSAAPELVMASQDYPLGYLGDAAIVLDASNGVHVVTEIGGSLAVYSRGLAGWTGTTVATASGKIIAEKMVRDTQGRVNLFAQTQDHNLVWMVVSASGLVSQQSFALDADKSWTLGATFDEQNRPLISLKGGTVNGYVQLYLGRIEKGALGTALVQGLPHGSYEPTISTALAFAHGWNEVVMLTDENNGLHMRTLYFH